MSEVHENLEFYHYDPKEFFLLVGVITIIGTFFYLMCMCMNKYHKFKSVVDGRLEEQYLTNERLRSNSRPTVINMPSYRIPEDNTLIVRRSSDPPPSYELIAPPPQYGSWFKDTIRKLSK